MEWVGLLAVVALLLVGMLAAGVRVPGVELARAVASRMLCAVAMADGCGDEPALIAAYGDEIGRLARRHMPTILFERGSRALPVDFRRCRVAACGDGTPRGLVHRTDSRLPVTAFVHVVDCREGGRGGGAVDADPRAAVDGARHGIASRGSGPWRAVAGATHPPPPARADCSGVRAGNLYIQYWTYYADSATLRGMPVAGAAGYHRDDWEVVQLRIGPDGSVGERASSHHGYNYAQSLANAGSDAGIAPLRSAAEAVGARPRNGWGPETRLLFVSGGSHAGNANGFPRIDRITPGRRVHLIPLEPIAVAAGPTRFAVSPPWRKRAWCDPEASGTD